jgi:hypothetical protein
LESAERHIAATRPILTAAEPPQPEAALQQAQATIQRLEQEKAGIELALRTELWLGHGHDMLYGDDGEMQCGRCHPTWDYKRMPLEDVTNAANQARLMRVKDALDKKHLTAAQATIPYLQALVDKWREKATRAVSFPSILTYRECSAELAALLSAIPAPRAPHEEETKEDAARGDGL